VKVPGLHRIEFPYLESRWGILLKRQKAKGKRKKEKGKRKKEKVKSITPEKRE
jgi:hypothetical protein